MVVVLAYLSLVPQDMEVRTTLPPGVEHFIAYAGTAGLLTLGYPGRKVLRSAAALILYSAALKLCSLCRRVGTPVSMALCGAD